MINKREAYIALFAILFGICNIFLIIFGVDKLIIQIFSFALTLSVFYFAWRELETLDFVKQIRTILLLGALEKDIASAAKSMNEAHKVLKDANNPWDE